MRALTVFAIPDADLSGRIMLQELDDALRLAGWTGDLLAVRLPTNDVSELHVKHGREFDRALNACLVKAESVPDVLSRFAAEDATKDEAMTKLFRHLLPAPGIKPVDKIILLTVSDQTNCDASRPLGMPKKRLAQMAGIPRRTLFGRLPRLIEAGLLLDHDGLLHLGPRSVQ